MMEAERFLNALKKAVANGDLTKTKGSYKLKRKKAPKKKEAPKKKVSPKKKNPLPKRMTMRTTTLPKKKKKERRNKILECLAAR